MKTNLNYDQYIPTRILFGAGALNNLRAQPMPGKRALMAKLLLVEPFVDTQNAANQRNRTRKPTFFAVCSPKSEIPATFAVGILRSGLVIQHVESLSKPLSPF